MGGRVGEAEFSDVSAVYEVFSGGNEGGEEEDEDEAATICYLSPYPGTVDSHVMVKTKVCVGGGGGGGEGGGGGRTLGALLSSPPPPQPISPGS